MPRHDPRHHEAHDKGDGAAAQRARVWRSGVQLALLAMISVGITGITALLTRDAIQAQQAQHQKQLLADLVPGAQTASIREGPLLSAQMLGLSEAPRRLLTLHREQTLIATILPVSTPGGYAGPIHMLLALSPDHTLIGVRVLAHGETPGLGDAIEAHKSHWIDMFAGKSLQNPEAQYWALRRDGGEFDGITRATVTSRAVLAGVAQGLSWFATNQPALPDAQDEDKGTTAPAAKAAVQDAQSSTTKR